MLQIIRKIYRIIVIKQIKILTFIKCIKVGLPYNKTWQIYGKLIISRPNRFHKKPIIKIGYNFLAQGTLTSNSFGIIQPNYFHLSPGAELIIGNNFGISGSTLSSAKSLRIGDNVLIGSGCVVCDNDAHPINPSERFDHSFTKSDPIVIEDNVFIGARSIILKGVSIGKGSVVGAGSVVTKSIPPFSVAAGNPAKVVKSLK
jgi:acetyltransferase-like isoleucine patch superfamily enzyme